MSVNLCAAYDAAGVFFPAALISPGAAARLSQLVRMVGGGADTFGFEVRLHGDERVDLGIGINARGAAHAALIDCQSTDDRRRRIRDLAIRWMNDPSMVARLPFLFLEVDCEAATQALAVPSVFLGLDWPLDELAPAARLAARSGDWQAAPGFRQSMEMVNLLRELPLPTPTETLLARCFALVPDGGLVLHIAVMLGRPGEGVRTSVMLRRDHVLDYLHGLGWEAGLDTLREVLRALAPFCDFEHPDSIVQIDLDIGASVGPLLGLMLRPNRLGGWPLLLDALVHVGWCTPQKRTALLEWPGDSPARLADNGASRACMLRRDLAHAKLACAAALEPKAKAYFGVTPHWLD
jgi:hypothetical protein